MQCHIWLKRWESCYCCFVLARRRMHYWFYMLDGLSAYSALLILTFIANMFPLIGSFVKERRVPVPFWQWLITIISCLSIFDKPTVTQKHGWKQHLYAFACFLFPACDFSLSVTSKLCQQLLLLHLFFFLFFWNHFLMFSLLVEQDKEREKERKKVFTLSQHHCQYLLVIEKFWDTHLCPCPCCSHRYFWWQAQFCNLAAELSTL